MPRYTPQFAPLRSSALSYSSGPSSPKSPKTPPTVKRIKFKSPRKRRTASSPGFCSAKHLQAKFNAHITIDDPMPWLWVCHRCHTRWPLGVSRRCLHDGHYFCGGTTVDSITGKVKKHKACGSEFDYIGWEKVGNWRDQFLLLERTGAEDGSSIAKKSCEDHCIYPSACHWRTTEQRAASSAMDLSTPHPNPHQQQSEEREALAKQIQRSASFDFLPADRIATASCPPSAEAVQKHPHKRTGTASSYFSRLFRAAAEKTTSQFGTLLSPTPLSSSPDDEGARANPNPLAAHSTTPNPIPGLHLDLLHPAFRNISDGDGGGEEMVLDTDYVISPLHSTFAVGDDASEDEESDDDVDVGMLDVGIVDVSPVSPGGESESSGESDDDGDAVSIYRRSADLDEEVRRWKLEHRGLGVR